MSDQVELDVAIVGGGIMGFWNAYEILKKNPNLTVALFEKESYFAEHTSGRNSEVLHAGIYYETGSLKHLHCLEGNKRWREFTKKHQVPFLDSGKYIIALEMQQAELEKLYEKAILNSVPGIRYATASEIQNLAPYLELKTALYSPSSGVLDVSTSIKALKSEIESLGGMVFNKTLATVETFTENSFVLKAGEHIVHARRLLNCAGLKAVEFRKSLNLLDYSDYFVKGNYVTLSGTYPAKNLIYPIPPAHGLGLGVHLTLDIAGGVKFGPNTEEVNSIEYSVKNDLIETMYPEIHRIFKTVPKEQLHLGYSGIRPKVKKDGVLKKDFVIQTEKEHGLPGYIEFLGIESPGLTAAPSLAQFVATNYF